MQTITDSQGPAQEELFLQALYTVAHAALSACPDDKPRLQKAVQLVLDGKVQPSPTVPGEYLVTATCKGHLAYRATAQYCDCADYPRAPKHRCKHRLSVKIYERVQQKLADNPWFTTHTVDIRDQQAGVIEQYETVIIPVKDRYGNPTRKEMQVTHTLNTIDDQKTQSLTALVCAAEYGHRHGGQHAQTAGR